MIQNAITVEATLMPDGLSLQLAQKLALAPGRVSLTVHRQEVRTPGLTMLETLDQIQGEQQRLGRTPMSEEEMASELSALRAEDCEDEERWREICSQARTPPQTD